MKATAFAILCAAGMLAGAVIVSFAPTGLARAMGAIYLGMSAIGGVLSTPQDIFSSRD